MLSDVDYTQNAKLQAYLACFKTFLKWNDVTITITFLNCASFADKFVSKKGRL